MAWEAAEKVQKNDAGEYRAFINGAWTPVARAQKSETGEFRVERAAPAAAPAAEAASPEAPGFLSQAANVARAFSPSGLLPTPANLRTQRDLLAGAVRGAGSIGATVLRPFESGEENAQRRADITAGLQSMGAQPESLAFRTGKLGGEIAGTAGAGGVLAAPVRAVAPRLAASLASGGMVNNLPMWLRMGGGAAVGGTSAAMIEPTQENILAGTVLGGAAPAVVSGLGAIRNWLSPDSLAKKAVLNSLDNDPNAIAAIVAANRAAPAQRAREVAGEVSEFRPGYQTLLARSEQQAGLAPAAEARATSRAANEATLAELAGGPTATAAEKTTKTSRQALNVATTPLRDEVSREAAIANRVFPVLERKASEGRAAATSAVEDVRRFTKAVETSDNWAANWKPTPAAGEPNALYNAPALPPTTPVPAAYPGQLGAKAEQAAGNAAEESLRAGGRARAAENTLASMKSRGIEPLTAEPLVTAIAAKLRKPDTALNPVTAPALRRISDMATDWTNANGYISPEALIAIRKHGVNGVIDQLMPAATAKAKQKAAAVAMAEIKPLIDAQLGAKFKTYLETFENGSREIDKQRLAAYARDLFSKDENAFRLLVEGNNPNAVRKITKGTTGDIQEVMGDKFPILEQIAKESALQKSIAAQATSAEGQASASAAIADAQRSFRIPNMLSAKVMAANTAFKSLEGKVNAKALIKIRDAAQSGADMNELITALPPSERSRVLAVLRQIGSKTSGVGGVNMMSEQQ
jgi:hypothetical protein